MASKKSSVHLRREILCIILTGMGIFVLICLLTYHPDDPSFSTGYAKYPEAHNWGGIIGAYIADGLFQTFGIMAYGVVIALFYYAATILFSQLLAFYSMRTLLLCILFLTVEAFLSLSIKGHNLFPYYFHHFDAGGIIGYFVSKIFVTYLNIFGTYFILTLTILLTIMGIAKISYISIWKKVFQIVTATGQSQCRQLGALLQKIKVPSKEKIIKRAKTSKPPKVNAHSFISEKISINEGGKDDQNETIAFEPDLSHPSGTYTLPSLALLDSPPAQDDRIDRSSLKKDAETLIQKFEDFGVRGKVVEICPGPVITRFEFEPASGIKINKIVGLSDDLALALKALSIRIVAPVPGKSVVGIEIANKKRETVFFREIVGIENFINAQSKLTIGFGKDIAGNPVINDLSKMPHLLIAGSTGSGKSVLINTIICSILYKATPDEVKFLMIDPKRLELSHYEGIPHLLHPVVTDPKNAALALHWVVDEMERRYKKLAEMGVRDIDSYNKRIEKEKETTATSSVKPEKMPYIVVVIDELADLMMVSARDVEIHIARLAQMARASGIHLIVATQRPSVDILTGTIKVNFPSRISFQVSSKVDSRTILDNIGAERLLGRGDMLLLPPGTSKFQRIHGAYLSEGEITRVVKHIKTQGSPSYEESILTARAEETKIFDEEYDELYDEAVAIVTETRQVSISMLQRRLRVGYNRAARMIEKMEKEGVVGPSDGVKPRDVLVNRL